MTAELLEVANSKGEKYFTYIYNDAGITLYKKTAYASQGGALMTTYWYTDSLWTIMKAELLATANSKGELYFEYSTTSPYTKTSYTSQAKL